MEAQQDAPAAKLEVNVDVVVDGQPLHIEAKVAGEGEAAQRAVEVLSEAIARVIAASVATTPPIAQPSVQPSAAKQLARHKQQAGAPSPAMVWLQRNRARINIGFGALLVALALLIPLIVPPAQRSEVLILTILFTLSGALLLFTAFLPGRGRAAAGDEARVDSAQPAASPAMTSSSQAARRAQLLKPAAKRSPLRVGAGIALSLVFIIAGLLAPFLLGAANADERFLIMLGFVPITVVGFFMLAIFGRQYVNKVLPAGSATPAKAAGAPAKRAPVSRVPQNFEYRAIVPVAIAGALALMIIVVAVVIFATIASVAR